MLSAATSPSVWLSGLDLGTECTTAFARVLPDAKVDLTGADTRMILAQLRAQPENARQVLLLNGRPVANVSLEDYATDLKAIVEEAHRQHLDLLWFDAPPGNPGVDAVNQAAIKIMNAQGVMTVDFNAFTRALLPKGAADDTPLTPAARRRQGEFLAEAVTQWWAACSTANPATQHLKLWSGRPPAYEQAGPERVNRSARIDHVAEPELVRFFPKKREHAPAVIFFPGGGYGFVGFLRNAKELAERLDPLGIAVIGLKYRTGRPVEVPLLDAERAIRYVRNHAAEWGLDPDRIGVAGQSAGANLVLNLAGHFDAGDSEAADPVERTGSRPDFMIVLTSWNFGKTTSTFTFPADTPPVFLRHAKNDSGFPIAEQIVTQLQALGVPLDYQFLDKGGHGAFELSPENPGSGWPDDFVAWLRQLGLFGVAPSVSSGMTAPNSPSSRSGPPVHSAP